MGGGTGIYPVVTALKELPVKISTIVAVSDSGGSTGRIRDEFGFPPVGDLRQSLAALAQDDGQAWIRKILLYRFEKGTSLQGHNLGNLILTALQDMTGSTTQALQIAEKIFRLEGDVIPVTEENVQLKINYSDGSSATGEHILDNNQAVGKKIKTVSLIPNGKVNPVATAAIQAAHLVIIGPGDFYASLMAVLVANGMKTVLTNCSAKVVYVLNLMTRSTQTSDMSAADHVKGIETVIGRNIDQVVINASTIPKPILKLYAAENEYPVKNDLTTNQRVIMAPLLEEELFIQSHNDTAHRSLLRHSQEKLKQVLVKLLWTSLIINIFI